MQLNTHLLHSSWISSCNVSSTSSGPTIFLRMTTRLCRRGRKQRDWWLSEQLGSKYQRLGYKKEWRKYNLDTKIHFLNFQNGEPSTSSLQSCCWGHCSNCDRPPIIHLVFRIEFKKPKNFIWLFLMKVTRWRQFLTSRGVVKMKAPICFRLRLCYD